MKKAVSTWKSARNGTVTGIFCPVLSSGCCDFIVTIAIYMLIICGKMAVAQMRIIFVGEFTWRCHIFIYMLYSNTAIWAFGSFLNNKKESLRDKKRF